MNSREVLGPENIPAGTAGNFSIVRRNGDDPERQHGELYTVIHGGSPMSKDETWVGLFEGKKLWMSNTPNERQSMYFRWPDNCAEQPAILVGGLGLGLVLQNFQRRSNIPREVVVIEKQHEVIELVWPTYEDLPGYSVICGDIREFGKTCPTKDHFDVAFVDIWGNYNTDLLADMSAVRRSLRRIMRPGRGRVICWKEGELRYERQRGRAYGW